MKQYLWVVAAATVMCACSTPGQQSAWGKPNVTKVDYGTDIGMCTGMAAMVGSGNAANSAGGVHGQNPEIPKSAQEEAGRSTASSTAQGGPAPGTAGAPVTGVGGAYRDSMPQDQVSRAANQEQAQVMAVKRARAATFKSCISQKGYQEFMLTAEQRAELANLKNGSNAYHEYLYKLGADPAVLQSQGTK
jgi:hypothetical protein